MRVRPRWADEREGSIHDLACWEPEGMMAEITLPEKLRDVEPVRSVRTPASLEYVYTAGVATTRFLKGIAEGKILGERAPGGKVYVPVPRRRPRAGQAHRPSRSSCPTPARSPASAW